MDEALAIAELGRAKAFVELLASRLSANPTQQLTVTPPTIEQIKRIAKEQNGTLVQYSIITDLEVIAEKGQGKELELYIWVVKPTGEVGFLKVDLNSLDTPLKNLVASSRQSLGVPGRATAEIVLIPGTNQKQRLHKLHDLLIKPIADLLPADPNAHVIFIPQQELFLVPFAALQDEREKYLIEKHTILIAPSIQVLELTRQKREMKAFYLQLQQNPDKAQALRQAMLSIMKQRPHPKDWAAFTLIGEAE